MTLTPQLIDYCQAALVNPKSQDLPNRPLSECLLPTDYVVAKHTIAKEFLSAEFPQLPKVVFYIILDNVYGFAREKDANGDLGYRLKYNPSPSPAEGVNVE